MNCQHCGSKDPNSCDWIDSERARLRHEGYLDAEIDAWTFRNEKETPPCWVEYPDIKLDWRWFIGGIIFGMLVNWLL